MALRQLGIGVPKSPLRTVRHSCPTVVINTHTAATDFTEVVLPRGEDRGGSPRLQKKQNSADIGFGHSDVRTLVRTFAKASVNIEPDAQSGVRTFGHFTDIFVSIWPFLRTFFEPLPENGHSDIGSDIRRTLFCFFPELLTGT